MGDVLKSFFACLLGKWLAGETGLLVGGFMAVVGHNWPVFCGFSRRQGHGRLAGHHLRPFLADGAGLSGLEVLVAALTGYVSVASLTTAGGLSHRHGHRLPKQPRFLDVLHLRHPAGGGGHLSHRANIRRLLSGTENRLNFKKIKVKPDEKTKG